MSVALSTCKEISTIYENFTLMVRNGFGGLYPNESNLKFHKVKIFELKLIFYSQFKNGSSDTFT